MRPPVKVAAFAAGLAVALGLGYGVGRAAGPLDGGTKDQPPTVTVEVHDGHGG